MGQEEERRRVLQQQKRSKRQRTALKKTFPEGSRHVAWTADDMAHYELVRPGIALAGGSVEADELFAKKQIREAHFFIWQHKDPNVQRNPSVPKYEATYLFADSNQHVRVKKCHLKVGYQEAGRFSHANMWSVDRLPYWVDRYAFSKLKQQSSKRKYEDNKRAPDKDDALLVNTE